MNTQKKFNMVDIIILTLMVSSEAIFKTVADLLIAVPGFGQIDFGLAELYTVLIWSIVIIWFVFKLGLFGTSGLILTVGGVLSLLGISIGLAAGVAIAVILANNQKLKMAAEVITAPENAVGEVGAAAEAGEAVEAAKGVEQVDAAATEQTGATAGAEFERGSANGAAGRAEGGAGAEKGTEKSGESVNPEALGESPEPMEELERNLTGENPVREELNTPEEAPEKNASDEKGDLEKEREAKEDRAERLRKLIDKLPQNNDRQSSDGDDNDNLAAAA
jgi:hypothetical protein